MEQHSLVALDHRDAALATRFRALNQTSDQIDARRLPRLTDLACQVRASKMAGVREQSVVCDVFEPPGDEQLTFPLSFFFIYTFVNCIRLLFLSMLINPKERYYHMNELNLYGQVSVMDAHCIYTAKMVDTIIQSCNLVGWMF